jgi:hypothetical protein
MAKKDDNPLNYCFGWILTILAIGFILYVTFGLFFN